MRPTTFAPLLAAALWLCLSASAASATDTLLRWTHSAPAEVTSFSVHLGYSPRSYDEALTQTFAGLVPGADGIYRVTLDIEPDRMIYVAVRAHNGTETSVFSNERFHYLATPLGMPGRPRISQ